MTFGNDPENQPPDRFSEPAKASQGPATERRPRLADHKMPTTAFILAAGCGSRIRTTWQSPKGILPFGQTTLIQRSLHLLRRAGMQLVKIAVGYRSEEYRRLLGHIPWIELVQIPQFASTDNMVSLSHLLSGLEESVLLLEGDLVYEARALTALLEEPADDVLLLSGPTDAGDEVWVFADDARSVRSLSKSNDHLPAATGEYAGISKISPALARILLDALDVFAQHNGHRRMSYDTDALSVTASHWPIKACLVPDLIWGEVDTPEQLRRVTGPIEQALAAKEPTQGQSLFPQE